MNSEDVNAVDKRSQERKLYYYYYWFLEDFKFNYKHQ